MKELGGLYGDRIVRSVSHWWSSGLLLIPRLNPLTPATQRPILSVWYPIILHLTPLLQSQNPSACPPTHRHQHLTNSYRLKSGNHSSSRKTRYLTRTERRILTCQTRRYMLLNTSRTLLRRQHRAGTYLFPRCECHSPTDSTTLQANAQLASRAPTSQ
jgi:hypothetical protein